MRLVRRVIEEGWSVGDAAAAYAVSERTVWKWIARYRDEGELGLQDRSSRPQQIARRLSPALIERATQLRVGSRRTVAAIAADLGLPRSTLARDLRRRGWGRLPPMNPPPPVIRYEHDHPGDLIHLDVKKLGRFRRPGHRVTGDKRTDSVGAGYDYVHVCIDDASRVAYVEVLPDERRYTTTRFLLRALRWLKVHGVRVQRVMTDNGSPYVSKVFAKTCRWLGLKHKRTRPYTPRTNGKAERFIQTLQREWAYAKPYADSNQRAAALPAWLEHYNHFRPHTALHQQPPFTRIAQNPISQ